MLFDVIYECANAFVVSSFLLSPQVAIKDIFQAVGNISDDWECLQVIIKLFFCGAARGAETPDDLITEMILKFHQIQNVC